MNPVQSATATFTWNNPTNAPFNLSQLGPIVGSATVAQGSTVQPNLKDERFDDMGVVIQHQLGNSLSIEGGFIFRELHHAWETINLALPANGLRSCRVLSVCWWPVNRGFDRRPEYAFFALNCQLIIERICKPRFPNQVLPPASTAG